MSAPLTTAIPFYHCLGNSIESTLFWFSLNWNETIWRSWLLKWNVNIMAAPLTSSHPACSLKKIFCLWFYSFSIIWTDTTESKPTEELITLNLISLIWLVVANDHYLFTDLFLRSYFNIYTLSRQIQMWYSYHMKFYCICLQYESNNETWSQVKIRSSTVYHHCWWIIFPLLFLIQRKINSNNVRTIRVASFWEFKWNSSSLRIY